MSGRRKVQSTKQSNPRRKRKSSKQDQNAESESFKQKRCANETLSQIPLIHGNHAGRSMECKAFPSSHNSSQEQTGEFFMEADEDFDHILSSLPEAMMDGSCPLPDHDQENSSDLFLRFPDHILENIFSCVPAADMLEVCPAVCKSWKNLIENETFMPWKKKYLRLRNNDEKAYKKVKSLCSPVRSTKLTSDDFSNTEKLSLPVVTLIRKLQDWKPTGVTKKESDDTFKSLQTHELCMLAEELIKKRVVDSKKKKRCTKSHCWGVAATILCLSTTAGALRRLRNCLLTVHSLHLVMDFFYMAAAFAWVLFKENLLSQEFHYKIFCSISSVENTTFPKPFNFDRVIMGPGAERLTYEQLKVALHQFQTGEVVRVIAYAGTGKTTTLASCVRANPGRKFLYTSFSKAVIEQSREVFMGLYNVECRTMHSLAYWGMDMRNHQRKMSRGSFRSGDVRDRLQIPDEDKQLPSLVIKTINRFLSSKDNGIKQCHVPTRQRVKDPSSCTRFEDISPDRKKHILTLSKLFWKHTADLSDHCWQMTDDCYLKMWQMSQPVIYGYDVIMLDEAQDCTECMRGVLEIQLNRCALVLVGDSHQQIYGFRSASDALVTMSASHSYYLTQSFRFGHDIALVADCILRAFKFDCEPTDRLLVSDKTLLGVGGPGTVCGEAAEGQLAILCRSNLGVMKQVLASLQKDPSKKVSVVGGAEKLGLDLMLELYALTKPPNVRAELGLKVKRKELKKYKTLQELERESNLTDDENMLQKIDIVRAFGDELPKIVETLKSLPRDVNSSDIAISTVHKAKGLEFDSVLVNDDFAKTLVGLLMSGQQLTKYMREEANLLYVAATRAKKSLLMSKTLCDLLQFKKIHFLSPVSTSNLDGQSLYCESCKVILSTETTITFYQPKIEKMQDEGPLCQKCAALLAPGWGHLLGDLDEIKEGTKQFGILLKQRGKNFLRLMDDDDEEPDDVIDMNDDEVPEADVVIVID